MSDPLESLNLTLPTPANITLVPEAVPESKGDAFMRTTDEYVTTMMKTSLIAEDPIYHNTVISADDALGISRLIAMGYEPAFGHPHIDPDKRLAVYRRDRATYEAEYELQCKALQKKMYSNPNVDQKKIDKGGKDPVRVVDNLPEQKYEHEESMQQLINEGAGDRFAEFDPGNQ